MPTTLSRRLAAVIMALLPSIGFADETPLPKASQISKLSIHPASIELVGVHDAAQLIVTAHLNDGRLQDLTTDATYSVADDKTVHVTGTGRLLPRNDGATSVTVSYSGMTATVPVNAARVHENLPINFANQIEPIFTKLDCNSGGCHGKASGQNGFKLSLLGGEPENDYAYLVKEGRGRRIMPEAPEYSLVLRKAVGDAPHGGGKRMEKNSDEYKLVRRWIAAGMPYGSEDDPIVTNITVFPDQRILTRQNKQQFAVYAHYSDGSSEDITRRAQYESNDQDIATVDEAALVRTLDMSGEAAIMARYQGHVAVFRATVPLGMETPEWQFAEKTIVDKHTSKKWRDLGLVPSDICSDEMFIRRVHLDITGTLPKPADVTAFIADKDAAKRDKLVDKLLDTPEYAYYFANKWADILRVKRGNQAARATATFGFHDWIRESIANDRPYDEFARAVLCATGDERRNPTTFWYQELTKPEDLVDDTAQVFLGMRIACAQCHHHPYEKWSQDDYWGMAAFFGRLGRKNIPLPPDARNQRAQLQVIFAQPSGSVRNTRTNQSAPFKPLDGDELDISPEEDPRQLLVDWMVNKDNPFFAKALVNRYWAHFFGRGIVDPLDDMRVTNPPSNPELLDALAAEFTKEFSTKQLIATICKSRTYQLAVEPNEFNKHDKQNYARYYPKRMSAEVLLDAVCQVTNNPTFFNGLPKDKFSPNRAIMLPDESFNSYFLDVFGRPQRISSCECERVSEANLAQSLHLLNSDEVQGKISAGDGRAALLAKDERPDAEKIEELFLWAFSRKPTEEDLSTALEHIAKHESNKKLAYENILWALLNTKEFVFNQ